VDSRPDRVFEGMVSRVAPYVLDVLEQNRTVEVEVALDDAAAMAGVLPGTSADAEVILVAQLHELAKTEPRAASWLLPRINPDR
jgi:HlyD family secretion protein